MALVTVQRSPSPSQSRADLDEGDGPASAEGSRVAGKQKRSRAASVVKRCINSVRFLSRIRTSESYFTIKGAALILPNAEACKRKATKAAHGGDMQNHLQAMCRLLRPQDTLQVAVRLESVYAPPLKRARYFAVVSCTGRQSSEESVVLGFDCIDDDTKTATVGLVLPIWANTCTSMNGDGGFTIRTANDRTANEKTHIFKPVTVQAMWSGLHVLHKMCDNATACCYVPSGLTHTWVSYYESKLALADPLAIGEWNMTDDLIAAVKSGEGNLACTPTVSEHEDIKKQIRPKLREIMIRVDLEDLTSVYLREQLEAVLNRNLKEYKSFIDEEMIVVMGQLDSPSHIFDFLFLGSEWNASNLDELNRNGIGYILNVTKEIDNFFPGLFKYHNVRVYDTEDTDLLKYWEATHKFILRAVEANSKVLVHCKMGVSRSASTVIAFAMKQYNWSFEKAHDFVLARRSVVRPNDGFRHQLQLYEGILKASNQRHSDLWRSKSESNLKVQMHGTLSTMQLESHAECCPADEGDLGNCDRSATESSSRGMGSSTRYRQSDVSVPGTLRPRSWSSRSMDRDQCGLTGTKSTSCLMELDSSLGEDNQDEDQSSSSSDDSSSDSGGSESDDANAFSGAEVDSKQLCRHQRCYDVTACADSSAGAHGGSTLAADCAASTPETLEMAADQAAATPPAAGECVVAAAAAVTVTRPRTLDVSPRPPPITSHTDGSSALSEGASCRAQVSPLRIACSSRAAGLAAVASTEGPHRAAEPQLVHAKSGSSPCGSTSAAKGSCPTAAPLSAVTPASATCAAVRGWVHPVQQQPLTPDAAGSPGPNRTSPCIAIGGKSKDMSPAKILVQELLGSFGSPSDELTVTGIVDASADQSSLGSGAARPSSLEWIWKQRYAKEDIPWSPGAVRRQKDMLECVRARALINSTAAGSTFAAAVITPEAVSTTSGVPASLECAPCPESDPSTACNMKTDDPCSVAAASTESYQPAPGTVRKVRREFEERLISDDGEAAKSCTVQRSSSLRGLPQLPFGRPLPATLQRSASTRERRSAGCLCQAGDDGGGHSDAAGTISSPRPVSAVVVSPSPTLPRGHVTTSSSTDLREHAGSSGAVAGVRTVERAASLTCLTTCPLPAADSVKFFLGSRKAACERRQPSGMHLADSCCTSAVNKQKQTAISEPDAPLSASHFIMHHKSVSQPLRRHVVQQLRDDAAPHVSVQALPVTMCTERGLRRCKSNSGSPSVPVSKKVHGTAQYGGQELAVSPQLKHTSSVRNLVYIFEASWRDTCGVKEEGSAQHVQLAAGKEMLSPQSTTLVRSPGQASPLIRAQSFCLPCRRCTGDQWSTTNGGRLRAGHSSSRRPRIASAVFPTT